VIHELRSQHATKTEQPNKCNKDSEMLQAKVEQKKNKTTKTTTKIVARRRGDADYLAM
jgi:hypothetical protein